MSTYSKLSTAAFAIDTYPHMFINSSKRHGTYDVSENASSHDPYRHSRVMFTLRHRASGSTMPTTRSAEVTTNHITYDADPYTTTAGLAQRTCPSGEPNFRETESAGIQPSTTNKSFSSDGTTASSSGRIGLRSENDPAKPPNGIVSVQPRPGLGPGSVQLVLSRRD